MTLRAQSQPPADLRLVLKTALDAVIVMNSDGIVAEWNDRAVEVFGWSRAEAVGRTMADLIIPPAFRAAHYRGLRKFLDTGEGPILRKRIEVTGMRKSGEEFSVELSISPVEEQGAITFVGCLRDISERKRAEDQQKLLLAELNHRVKNTLSVVSGIASQTARTSKTLAEFSDKFFARLQTLGRAHDMLMARKWGVTSLHDLVADVFAPFGAVEAAQIAYAGPQVALSPSTTLSLSLILHELVTNASKHGALSGPTGKVSMTWDLRAETPLRLLLRWRESGLSNIEAPARSGFGTRMIETSTRHDLGGQVDVTFGSEGVRYDFEFPLS
jgi:PAS domain S-box-containing protein